MPELDDLVILDPKDHDLVLVLVALKEGDWARLVFTMPQEIRDWLRSSIGAMAADFHMDEGEVG